MASSMLSGIKNLTTGSGNVSLKFSSAAQHLAAVDQGQT